MSQIKTTRKNKLQGKVKSFVTYVLGSHYLSIIDMDRCERNIKYSLKSTEFFKIMHNVSVNDDEDFKYLKRKSLYGCYENRNMTTRSRRGIKESNEPRIDSTIQNIGLSSLGPDK